MYTHINKSKLAENKAHWPLDSQASSITLILQGFLEVFQVLKP